MSTRARTLSKLVDSQQLGEFLVMSRKAVYTAVERGQLPPPIRIGSRLRWRQEDIEAWLEEQAEIRS